MNLTIDKEFKSLIPPLTSEEREQLEVNIIQDGCRDPLVVWGETLIDGHNRHEICQRNNIRFSVVQKDFDGREAAKEWIILNQFGRRNLKPFQRVELAEKFRPILEKKAKERQSQAGGDKRSKEAKSLVTKWGEAKNGATDEKLAQLAGVGEGSIYRGRKVLQSATEEEKQALREGRTAINTVYTAIQQREKPKHTQHCISCKQEKPPTEFYPGKKTCKECLSHRGSKAQEERECRAIADAMMNNPGGFLTPDSELASFAWNLGIHTEMVDSAHSDIEIEKTSPETRRDALAAIGKMETALASLREKLKKGD